MKMTTVNYENVNCIVKEQNCTDVKIHETQSLTKYA